MSGKRKFDHISSTLRLLGWLSAEQLRDFYTVTVVRRVLTTSHPEELAALFLRSSDIHSRATRSADLMRPPRIRSEMGRRRFAYRDVYCTTPFQPRHVRQPHGKRSVPR